MRIISDWSEIDREIERVSSLAIMEAHAGLDLVLEEGANLVRGAIHVETGALKGAVHAKTGTRGLANWHGSITVGGASSGTGGGVDYAWYEYRRRGDHSFFYPLPLLHEQYVEAILNGLRK